MRVEKKVRLFTNKTKCMFNDAGYHTDLHVDLSRVLLSKR